VTEILQGGAAQLEPTAATAAEAAAARLDAGAVDCADALPGCRQYIAEVHTAAGRFAAFLAEARQGVEAYASIAAGTAATYTDRDAAARQAIPAATATGPRIPHA
jgi:hypothetical protein